MQSAKGALLLLGVDRSLLQGRHPTANYMASLHACNHSQCRLCIGNAWAQFIAGMTNAPAQACCLQNRAVQGRKMQQLNPQSQQAVTPNALAMPHDANAGAAVLQGGAYCNTVARQAICWGEGLA